MGWTMTYNATMQMVVDERIRTKEWIRSSDNRIVKRICLAHHIAREDQYHVLWIAWEDQVEGQEPDRWIECDLLEADPGYGWGYKDMEESMGPYYYSCPVKFFDLAPRVRNQKWRDQVIARAAK